MIITLKAGREDKHPVLRKAERVIVKIICLHVFLIHNAPEELVKALGAVHVEVFQYVRIRIRRCGKYLVDKLLVLSVHDDVPRFLEEVCVGKAIQLRKHFA